MFPLKMYSISIENGVMNKTVNETFGTLYFNTVAKNKLLKNKGYIVVEMWENKWRNGIKAVKLLQRLWRKRSTV